MYVWPSPSRITYILVPFHAIPQAWRALTSPKTMGGEGREGGREREGEGERERERERGGGGGGEYHGIVW